MSGVEVQGQSEVTQMVTGAGDSVQGERHIAQNYKSAWQPYKQGELWELPSPGEADSCPPSSKVPRKAAL